MQYERSAEVEKTATAVIRKHLPELKSKTIIYVTQDKKDDKTENSVPQMRKGRPHIGDIKIVGGLNGFLISGEARTDYDGPSSIVVVVASRHAWEHLELNQREAWLHQQLVRLEYNETTGKPSLADYDVKEMTMTTKLYGAWSDDLKLFLKTAKQHPLFADLDKEVQPVAAEAEPVAAENQPGNGAVKVEKAATAKGAANGDGKDKTDKAAKPTGLKTLKEEVARRRGGRQSARA